MNYQVQGHYKVRRCPGCWEEIVTVPSGKGQYVQIQWSTVTRCASKDTFMGRRHECPEGVQVPEAPAPTSEFG